MWSFWHMPVYSVCRCCGVAGCLCSWVWVGVFICSRLLLVSSVRWASSWWAGVFVLIGSSLCGGSPLAGFGPCVLCVLGCCPLCSGWSLAGACVVQSACGLSSRCNSYASFIVVVCLLALLLSWWGAGSAGSISTSCGSFSPSSSLTGIAVLAASRPGSLSAVASSARCGLVVLASGVALLLGCPFRCSWIWKWMVGVSCSGVGWGFPAAWAACAAGTALAPRSTGKAGRLGRSSAVGGRLV